MQPVWFSEADVERELSMAEALVAVEASLRALAAGQGVNHPRRRMFLPHGLGLHAMEAAVLMPPRHGDGPGRWYCGSKLYTTTRKGAHFVVNLFDGETGEALASFAADRLGQRRTGAASGVATRLLAAPEASTLGIIGAGWQAESQAEAICAVRPIQLIRVYSRRADACQAFAEKMSQRLGVAVESVAQARHAVQDADIVVTATPSKEPVLPASALRHGAHINAIGANALNRREIDGETVLGADRIVVDSLEQCSLEAGDLVMALGAPDQPSWSRVEELGEALAAGHRRSGNVRRTLFKSTGLALWDVACAARIWEKTEGRTRS